MNGLTVDKGNGVQLNVNRLIWSKATPFGLASEAVSVVATDDPDSKRWWAGGLAAHSAEIGACN